MGARAGLSIPLLTFRFSFGGRLAQASLVNWKSSLSSHRLARPRLIYFERRDELKSKLCAIGGR